MQIFNTSFSFFTEPDDPSNADNIKFEKKSLFLNQIPPKNFEESFEIETSPTKESLEKFYYFYFF
jgi:hypothetical protein